jgi:type III pantothenate kinase
MNFGVDMKEIPLNTKDAISAGMLHPMINLIKNISDGKTIYTTGGDGKFFSRFFDTGIYDKNLIFKGMKKVIEDNNLLEEFKI